MKIAIYSRGVEVVLVLVVLLIATHSYIYGGIRIQEEHYLLCYEIVQIVLV